MNRAGKLLVPVLGVLTALALGLAGVAFVLQTQEHEKRVAKEKELTLVLVERESLKTQLSDVQDSKRRTDDELAKLRQELSDTQDRMSKATHAQEELSRSVEDRQKELDRVTKDLEQARDERQRLAGQVNDLSSERESLQVKLADLERAKGELETKVLEMAGAPTVELEKVMVNGGDAPANASMAPAPTAAGAAAAGQIVVVNREYDFIVMNLGRKQGLAVGQDFQVRRGTQVLGTVKVEKIYDELSAAAIQPDSKKDDIREGDQVQAM